MLLVDAGNTRVAFAEWDGVLPGPVQTVPTASFALPAHAGPVAAASVVPAVTAELRKAGNVFLLENTHAAAAGLSLAEVDASTLGADRLANAVAALDYGVPALVLDCGSAITIELVDKDKRFLGGAIAPGRKLLRQTLHTNTAQLPEIPLSSRLPVFPGPNTVEALRFGIDRGAAGGARELIEACEKCYGKFNKIVTGGDAEFFALALDLPAAPDDFTLRGVLRIALAH